MTKTLIVMIIDESSSMSSKKMEVIDGYNDFIKTQKQVKDDIARVYLVKFNSVVTTVFSGVNIQDVPLMTMNDYNPSGYTALYDSIDVGVGNADRDKNSDERVVVVIMTDGEENSSRNTTLQQVRDIITGHEARGDWTFLYIGEGVDKWINSVGMSGFNAVQYSHFTPTEVFRNTSRTISAFRSSEDQQSSDLIESHFSR